MYHYYLSRLLFSYRYGTATSTKYQRDCKQHHYRKHQEWYGVSASGIPQAADQQRGQYTSYSHHRHGQALNRAQRPAAKVVGKDDWAQDYESTIGWCEKYKERYQVPQVLDEGQDYEPR